MTETEWLTCADPSKVYRLSTWSVRKGALLISECLRIFGKPDPAARGPQLRDETDDDMMIFGEIFQNGSRPGYVVVRYDTLDTPRHTLTADCEAAAVAAIMRDLQGNPFRPVALDPAWQTPTVVRLAQAIHDDRAFDHLPILADALEEAGCNDPAILNHCRGRGLHARGCWAVDLLLGKE